MHKDDKYMDRLMGSKTFFEEVYEEFCSKYSCEVQDAYLNDLNQLVVHTMDNRTFVYSGNHLALLSVPMLMEVNYSCSDELDNETYLTEFGERLELILLTKCHMSLDEIAYRIGVSLRTLYYWKNGDHWPSLIHLRAISSLSGCRIDDLVRWEY